MTDIIKLGLIGCGSHGCGNLLPAINTAQNAHIAACVDIDESKVKRTVADLGIENYYLDYNEMLREIPIDAVVIALPHAEILAAAMASINAGKHLFIDKPMALNAADGQTIVDAAKDKQVKVMVGYCQRYAAGRMLMKQLLAKGVVGDIDLVIAGKGSGPLGGWLVAPSEQGGGQLLFLGVHITDQILWLLNDYPLSVTGEIQWHEKGYDETSSYIMRFPDDIVASVSLSMNTAGGLDFIEIFGSAGRIRADWPSNIVQVRTNAVEEYRHPATIMVSGDNSMMYGAQMRAFVEAVRTKSDMPIPGEDGVKVLRIIDAVFESNRLKRPVNFMKNTKNR
ncbi:TPA: Gfo/Idh/MocA family oxidoreductase [Candidatus Poribacteria bacterium]|nr:Gfo/Idh/MocA family oxidoreductase [Candidatus Poribacteria bacterium]